MADTLDNSVYYLLIGLYCSSAQINHVIDMLQIIECPPVKIKYMVEEIFYDVYMFLW